MVLRGVFLAHNSNMMISTIKGRTHEISHAGIKTNVIFVGVLFMDSCGNQIAVRPGNCTAGFKADGTLAKSCWYHDFIIELMNGLSYLLQIYFLL